MSLLRIKINLRPTRRTIILRVGRRRLRMCVHVYMVCAYVVCVHVCVHVWVVVHVWVGVHVWVDVYVCMCVGTCVDVCAGWTIRK